VSARVVIPWRPAPGRNVLVRDYVEQRVRRALPEATVAVGALPGEMPWCKAEAVAAGLHGATEEVLVVHDADVVTQPEALGLCVQLVSRQLVPWAMPHTTVRRLSEGATHNVIKGGRLKASDNLPHAEAPYLGVLGGGVVVLTRELYERVPLDRRFVGWGHEDVSWAHALITLAGYPERLPRPLWHLWHQPQARTSRRRGSPESIELAKRYAEAAGNAEATLGLVRDGKVGTWVT
jgi:hypothetical protein